VIFDSITDGEVMTLANRSRRFSEDYGEFILDDNPIMCVLPHINLECTIRIDCADYTASEPALVRRTVVFDVIPYQRGIGIPDVPRGITSSHRGLILDPANNLRDLDLIGPIIIHCTNGRIL
jgi:hypothetical protein